MADATLVLRDIHQAAAPPWWPPAPGWWLLAALVLLVIALWAWFAARRRKRRRAIAAIFDQMLAAADTPGAQVAAMSELLRRAGRRRNPTADRLQGDAWLEFLDSGAGTADLRGGRKLVAKPRTVSNDFAQGPGRLLLEGGYRRDVDAGEVKALHAIARARFLDWMAAK